MIALVLWAPSAALAGFVWLLVPGPPTTRPWNDPLLHVIAVELLRSVPFATVLGVVASVLAAALWSGRARVRRPLQATLIVGALAPVALGLHMAPMFPLPEGLGSPVLWRLLLSLPVMVGAVCSGVPAVLAAWLLEKPEARAWAER